MPLRSILVFSGIAGLLSGNPAFARSTDCIPSDALLRAINSAAKKYSVQAELLTAISAVESCHGRYRFNATSRDYGLMQVNEKTAKAYQLNTAKLLTDDLYSLNAAALILIDLRRAYPRSWVCRYNIGTRRDSLMAPLCDSYLKRLYRAGYRPVK